ncbi:hypothetical protein C2E23DRAFT_42770 [Lenzites betulinus]|nr:hypothetical protein C2E23DRAFT_42770 [Lenzites betulinus]
MAMCPSSLVTSRGRLARVRPNRAGKDEIPDTCLVLLPPALLGAIPVPAVYENSVLRPKPDNLAV